MYHFSCIPDCADLNVRQTADISSKNKGGRLKIYKEVIYWQKFVDNLFIHDIIEKWVRVICHERGR